MKAILMMPTAMMANMARMFWDALPICHAISSVAGIPRSIVKVCKIWVDFLIMLFWFKLVDLRKVRPMLSHGADTL